MLKAALCTTAISILAFLTFAGAGAAEQPSQFGRLFPNLPAFTDPTIQQLADLVQTERDPGTDDFNNDTMPSGFTYFGQFLDHDLTLDTLGPPTAFVDPTTLTNNRTFRLDLDSVYGGGPSVSPELYEDDGLHFKVQEDNGNGVRDLPRNADGSAILIEDRNDENEIISQLHVAFLKAHNRLIDEGKSFSEAQTILTQNYQWAVVHDFLPHILEPGLIDRLLDKGKLPKALKKLVEDPTMTPVEFSVAAYRFGHSQVREAYEINEDTGKIAVFSSTEPDLRGGRPIPEGRQIEWGNFFNELTVPGDEDGVNISRKIDTLISKPLFDLPIPGAEATGSNVLPFRTLTREQFYGMPSGQDVAKELGAPVISPATLHLGPGFTNGTPLFYYILAESKAGGGERLGEVGSLIVGASFASVLFNDPDSYLVVKKFHPDEEIAGDDGVLTISDLLVFAGVVEDD